MAFLLLTFPFSLSATPRTRYVQTEILRSSAIVSFSLPHCLALSIPHARFLQNEHSPTGTVYLFEFDDLNKAIEFMAGPAASVEFNRRGQDACRVEAEAAHLLGSAWKTDRRAKKKKLLVDDEGFMYYG